jgi:hypothetical protein
MYFVLQQYKTINMVDMIIPGYLYGMNYWAHMWLYYFFYVFVSYIHILYEIELSDIRAAQLGFFLVFCT